MRSTKIAPLGLSNSYLTGSPPIGTSISTLTLCGTSVPDGIRSILMMALPLDADAPRATPQGQARSARGEQPVQRAIAFADLFEARIAKAPAPLNVDRPHFLAALDDQPDRAVGAPGSGHGVLQHILAIG